MAKDNKWFKTDASSGIFTGTREPGIDTGGSSGTTDVLTGNTLWVDKVNGDDGTGETGKQNLPFLTIAAAITASASADTILVRPGDYAESGLTLKTNTSLISTGGYEVTGIGFGAPASGTRVTLSDNCLIQGFTVTLPIDNKYGVVNGGTGTSSARFIRFNGSGGAISNGLANIGTGKLVAFEIRYGEGNLGNLLFCNQGILAIQSVHVPGTGVIYRGAKVTTGRLQILDMNIGNANVVYGVEVGTTGVAVLISLNLFNLKNGILLSANDVQVDALGGKIQTTSTMQGSYTDPGGIDSFTGRSVVVDSAYDLNAAVVRITAQMEPNFVWNNQLPGNAAGSDFTVNLIQGNTTSRDPAQRLFGVDSMIGFPERGSQFMSGEGGANATFNSVIQLTAAGIFGADITAAAADKTTTFGFGSVGIDESIAWCSTRRDVRGDLVKHWGLILTQEQSSFVASGTESYVFEIYTGPLGYNGDPLNWTEVGVMSVSVEEQYRYSNDVFKRTGSTEQLRFGITPDTPWQETDLTGGAPGGVTGFYIRARMATAFTVSSGSGPSFLQLKTTPSHLMLNTKGQRTAHGLSMWKSTLFGVGNSFSQLEGFVGDDGKPQVGQMNQNNYNQGWQLKIIKAHLDGGSTEGVGYQFNLPGGICTAYPLKIRLTMGNDSASGAGTSVSGDTTIGVGLLPIEVEGTLVSDPGGGITPIPRPPADTIPYSATTPAPDPNLQTSAVTVVDVTAYQLISKTFEFDISNMYEDDLITLCVQNLGGGSGNDVTIWTLQVEGVAFTEGKVL